MANEKKIDYVLLGILCHEDLTGYDIKKRLDTRLHFFWNASYGSIYPTLSRLEQLDMITSKRQDENGRERIVYSITNKGESYLRQWLRKPVIKDELRYETLLKLFFGNEIEEQVSLSHIREFQKKIREELLVLESCVASLEQFPDDKTHVYYLLTGRFGVETYKVYLKWCEEAIKVLERGIFYKVIIAMKQQSTGYRTTDRVD